MSAYKLCLFGGFDLRDDQGGAITIRSKKGRCLLAYLALAQDHQVGRELLAALLWGDRGDAQARRSLSQELYRLRGLFPEEMQDGFVLEAESVGLAEGLFDVDVAKFEHGLELGDPEAAALYIGELLAGQEVNQEGFDDWLRGERERLHERAIAGLHKTMRARLDGPTETALDGADRVLALDPASEEAHRAIMQLQANAGRRDLALKQYDKCRTLLAEELDIEPDNETQALYEQIKTAREPAAPRSDIPARPVPAGKAAERRQVTVMACGLLLEPSAQGALDPEDRREATRICRDVASALLERRESRIARTMADSFLTYFGYPEAREDDAERAARAGLEIVKAIGDLDLPVGISAHCRAGIASGLVVTGEDSEEALMGEAPDVAARLLQAAEPDMVLVSAETRELLASAFTLEELAGADESEATWRLLGEAHTESRFEAKRSSALTPFVGRELELQTLDHRWGQAEEGEGQVVLISGEPGIGKSRIAETTHERLPAEGHIRLLYQCSPHHTNSALHPVIEQLGFAAGLDTDEADDSKLDKLESLIALAGEDVEATAPLFADLLSIPHDGRYSALNLSPQVQKDRTLEALVAQLVGLAAHKPVLFVFEDVHWADPTTRELLELTVAAIEESRVLILFTFRPEYEAPWIGQAHTTVMTLNRLAKRQCGEMVRNVAAKADLPEDVLRDIVAKTDGVPLFVEELTKTMVSGADAAAVPATIQASLTARLDQLGPAREVAQIAAVIGREFSYPLLAAVAEMDENTLAARLEALTGSELVFARGTLPAASYKFKHALIRDAAYDSLLRGERGALHGRIAEALKARFPAIESNEPELLAHHYGQAGQVDLAIEYWRRAGDRALERSANVEAAAHFTKGLELLAALADSSDRAHQELALQAPLASALTAAKGHAAAETGTALMRARELCREVGDAPQMFEVLYGVWNYVFVGGDLHAALELAEEGFELVRHEGKRTRLMAAHCMLGQTLFLLGRFDRAQDHLEKSIALYAPEQDRSLGLVYGEHPGIVSLSFLPWVLWYKGFPEQAIAQSREPFDEAEEASHALSIGIVFLSAVIFRWLRREPKETQEFAQTMIEYAAEQTLPWVAACGTVFSGWAMAEQGRPEEGVARARRGVAASRATGARQLTPLFLALLAEGQQRCGNFEEGLNVLDEAFDAIRRGGEEAWQSELHRLRGACLLSISPDNAPEAETAFRRAIEVAKGQNARSLELRAAIGLARLWQDQGKTDEARELLAPVYDWFTEGFDTADLKEAKALLDELG